MQHTVRKVQAGQVGARQLANVAYGAARSSLGELVDPLFVASARAAAWRVSEFNSQNVANTAWAFATGNYREEKPFSALARAAERRVSEFNAQDLANMAWAFATASGRESSTDAWSLVQRARHTGHSLSWHCFGVLLVKCEQRDD